MDVMSLTDRSWPVLRRLMGGHALVYRATGGLVGHRFPGAPPMLLLEHVGARSGTRRTAPLVYVEDGRDVVCQGSREFPTLGAAGERAWLWPKAVATYRGSQQRTDREIPLVILQPRA